MFSFAQTGFSAPCGPKSGNGLRLGSLAFALALSTAACSTTSQVEESSEPAEDSIPDELAATEDNDGADSDAGDDAGDSSDTEADEEDRSETDDTDPGIPDESGGSGDADPSELAGGDIDAGDDFADEEAGPVRVESQEDVTITDPEAIGIFDVATDPVDDRTILVQFPGISGDCFAANGTVEETDELVSVGVEGGAIEGCDEDGELEVQELAIALAAPLGDRGLETATPADVTDDAGVEALREEHTTNGSEMKFSEFSGLPLGEAESLADQTGIEWRIVREDAEELGVTEDYNPDRVNFEVDEGIVTLATPG